MKDTILQSKKHVLAVNINDRTILARRVDEDILLEALGLSKSELLPTVSPDLIKYQPIAFIRAKSSDLVIYNRYMFLDEIQGQGFLRIWKGDVFWEFPIYSPEMARGIANAIDRVFYWLQKAKRLNWANKTFPKREEAFRKLPGTLLEDLMELSVSRNPEGD